MGITREQVDRFRRLFIGRENAYGQYLDGEEGKKKVWTKREETPEQLWADHLEGKGPYLGQVPIRLDNTCYWGALDLDDDGTDLAAVATKVAELGLPLVVCRSKSGGAHLYLFLSEPVEAREVVAKLTEYRSALDMERNADGRAVEIFPKQTFLRGSEPGNWINLPYYSGDATNRYAVRPDGSRLTLAQFLDLAEASALTEAALSAAVPVVAPEADDFFREGPPCLVTLHQLGFPAGTRNQGMYNVGCYLKLAYPDSWQTRLEEYNSASGKVDPPLRKAELEGLIKSLEKREYVYKCNELPIQPHCQKAKCKKCKFGIGGFRSARQLAMMPEFSNLKKLMTDPPRWQLTVNDVVTLDLTTDELMLQTKFRKAAMEKANLVVPMVKQFEWDETLRELLEDHEVVEAPADAGVVGQFTFLVREFLMNKTRADGREDLLRGLPWEEEGRIYFRSSDLMTFLTRRGFREFSFAEAYDALRRLGAGHHQFKVKGTCVQCWHLPAEEGQTEPFDGPELQAQNF